MALNLNDRIAVRRNIIDRCTAAVVKYANYILSNQDATTPQLAWAREAIRSPQSVGDQISWYVLDQPDYISDGSGITDQALQGAIEAAINTHLIQEA